MGVLPSPSSIFPVVLDQFPGPHVHVSTACCTQTMALRKKHRSLGQLKFCHYLLVPGRTPVLGLYPEHSYLWLDKHQFTLKITILHLGAHVLEAPLLGLAYLLISGSTHSPLNEYLKMDDSYWACQNIAWLSSSSHFFHCYFGGIILVWFQLYPNYSKNGTIRKTWTCQPPSW